MIGAYTLTPWDWAILIVLALWAIAVISVWRDGK